MRKRFILLFLILSVIVALGGFALRSIFLSGQAKKDLTFSIHQLDLGQVTKTTKVAKNISIVNENATTVHITSVSSSCGCTVATIRGEKQNIRMKPRESVEMTITFDGDMHEKGDDLDHVVYVQVSKPFEKEYAIPIKGNVI